MSLKLQNYYWLSLDNRKGRTLFEAAGIENHVTNRLRGRPITEEPKENQRREVSSRHLPSFSDRTIQGRGVTVCTLSRSLR